MTPLETKKIVNYFLRKLEKDKEDELKVVSILLEANKKKVKITKKLITDEKLWGKIESFYAKELRSSSSSSSNNPVVKKQNILDKNDINQFNWAGVRNKGELFEHPMKVSPMFFRRDGMNVDFINVYNGSSVFLVCNGPSLNLIDKSVLKNPGIFTMGINNGGHIIRPNLWTCVDDPSRFLRSIWEDPTIQKIVPQAHFEKPLFDKKLNKHINKMVGDCPNVYGYRRNETFKASQFFHENTINWGNHKDNGGGRSVMISALKICYLLGFSTVYLVGCDFSMSEDKKYFFEEERTVGAINNNNNSYKKMNQYFTELNEEMKYLNFKVYNCYKESGLKAFPFKTFDDAIKENTIDTSDSTKGMYISPKEKGK